jgi:hypothetical protein
MTTSGRLPDSLRARLAVAGARAGTEATLHGNGGDRLRTWSSCPSSCWGSARLCSAWRRS